MTRTQHRLFTWSAIIAGVLIAVLAAGWLLITALSLTYGLGEFQGKTTASTVILNYLPIAIVGGIPIVVGWLLLRFGLKRLRAPPGR